MIFIFCENCKQKTQHLVFSKQIQCLKCGKGNKKEQNNTENVLPERTNHNTPYEKLENKRAYWEMKFKKEESELKDLQKIYDIAMQEITRLLKELLECNSPQIKKDNSDVSNTNHLETRSKAGEDNKEKHMSVDVDTQFADTSNSLLGRKVS